MSPKQRAEQQSSGAAEHDVDTSGARGCRGRDGRLTSGSGPVGDAGYEARLVTLHSRSSVAGRLNGRAPGAPAARLTMDDVGARLAEPVPVPGWKRTATASLYRTALVLGVVSNSVLTVDSTENTAVVEH